MGAKPSEEAANALDERFDHRVRSHAEIRRLGDVLAAAAHRQRHRHGAVVAVGDAPRHRAPTRREDQRLLRRGRRGRERLYPGDVDARLARQPLGIAAVDPRRGAPDGTVGRERPPEHPLGAGDDVEPIELASREDEPVAGHGGVTPEERRGGVRGEQRVERLLGREIGVGRLAALSAFVGQPRADHLVTRDALGAVGDEHGSVELQFDAPAVGVPDVGGPVAAVRAEAFAGFALLDDDARLAELLEQSLDRLASVGVVGAKQQTDVLAADVERLLGGYQVEVPAAGDDGDERQSAGLELLTVANRQSEQPVVELESAIDVAHADRDVVEVRRLDHGATPAVPGLTDRSRTYRFGSRATVRVSTGRAGSSGRVRETGSRAIRSMGGRTDARTKAFRVSNRFMSTPPVSRPMPRGPTRARTESAVGEDPERRLREHERAFRRFIEHADEVFWINDPDRPKPVYVNPAFEAVWGRPREAFFEDPRLLLESVHPDDRERVEEAFENEIEQGGFDEVYRIQRPDGEIRWIHDRAFPVRDEDGEVDNVVGIAADVTERKRMEGRLRYERDRTERLLDTSPVPIFVFDADRTVTFGNERAKEVLSTEEIAGTPFSEFPWELLEDGEPVPMGRRPFDRVRRRDEPIYDLEYPALVDGRRRWLSVNGASLYDDGEFDGAVFAVEDVTDRKRREEALSTLHEAGTWMMRADSGEEICELTVAAAATMLPVSKAAIYAVDTDDHALRPVVREPAAATFPEQRPESIDDSPIWRAFVEGEPSVSEGTEPSTAAFPLGSHGVLTVVVDDGEGLDGEGVTLARMLRDDAEAALERTERDAALRRQRAALRRSNDQLERLNHVIDLMRDVTRAIVGAGSREEITMTVCERLAAADPYRFAWIGTAEDGEIVPGAWAGITRPYLDALDLSLEEGRSATVRAVRTGSPVVERALEGRDGERRADALSRDYRSIAAVPLSYRERSYGVLCVYSDREKAFDGRERGVLGELGETVGYAIDALETRNALASDGSTELRLRIRDPEFAPQRLASEGCRIEHRGMVPRSDGTSRWFVTAADTAPERMDELVAGIDRIESADRIGEDEVVYELLVRPPGPDERPCLFDETVEHGGTIESMVATDEEISLTVEMPTESSVRRFVEALRSDYRTVELVGRQDHDRPPAVQGGTGDAIGTELTDRQREILQVAYFSGYFEEPRETTGAELAERLGINRSTFHRTLRAAERASFASLLE